MLKLLPILAAACALAASPAFADPAAHPAAHAVNNACADDTQKFCADQAGTGPIAKCLRHHHDEVSEVCRTALDNARSAHHAAQDAAQRAPSGY